MSIKNKYHKSNNTQYCTLWCRVTQL